MKGVIRFLSGLVLVISIIALSACGKMHSGTDTGNFSEKNTEILTEEKGKEEVISDKAEPDLETESPWALVTKSDEVLKTMEVPLKNGEVLTLYVIGKKRDDVDLYGVREIRVYKKDELLQSVLIKEAIDKDGVDGIEEGYTACFTAEESAGLKDVNFDGYLDLEVCGWTPNNSIPYYYWCWNNDT
ncbi:MAG: hypothetical protein GXX10_02665 [Clostridiaceae bacterium]|nr:hypothetical protein [Clostridiaceae bacterium]